MCSLWQMKHAYLQYCPQASCQEYSQQWYTGASLPMMNPPRPPQVSMDTLSAELVVMISKQLRDMDYESLLAASQVSRRWNMFLTPVIYETVALNERIISPETRHEDRRALRHISLYTRHVVVRNHLRPPYVRRVLDSIDGLKTIRFICSDFQVAPVSLLPLGGILGPRHVQQGKVKIYVENLPTWGFGESQPDDFIRALPTDLIVSLRTGSSLPLLTTRLEPLKELLLRSPNLETFRYEDEGIGVSFTLTGSERLPPFKNLRLKNYDWNHDRTMVEAHWDLSRLRSLELISVPVFNFLDSVSFPDLSGLQHLRVEDFSAHLDDRRDDATRSLCTLIKDHIRQLRSLDIVCHTRLFPVDALFPHSNSLEKLCFRDHVGFSDDRRCPTLAEADVERLAQRLTVLRELDIDMEIPQSRPPAHIVRVLDRLIEMDETAQTDVPRFLRALANIPRLQTLTLHVPTAVRPYEDLDPCNADTDLNNAKTYFDILLRERACRLNNTGPLRAESWRCVTVNVGGWRPVILRRLDPAWRRQNRRGVFAERCFVMEPSAVPGQGYFLREEKCIGLGPEESVDDE